MVARIPYTVTIPKFYTIANGVATMRFLSSSELPIPEVYDYSPSSDSAAETEYIFMEFIRGANSSDVWLDLEEAEISSVLRQLVQLESCMMSIHFPAGRSLYYTEDLEKMTGRRGILLNDERFCVGVDARSLIDESAEAALEAVARKEIAYLTQFGRPLLPFQRERRESYEHKDQLPSKHIKNFERYLLMAPLYAGQSSLHRQHLALIILSSERSRGGYSRGQWMSGKEEGGSEETKVEDANRRTQDVAV
ncbi:hypothetical protein EV368DRAFT_67568 [Lentinula lateritia]|nr:hypothetical protein EV368DRAFT_67568 [Lentinula lateritia]